MDTNPVDIIKSDHRRVEALFEEFEKVSDMAYAERRQLADEIITELEAHAEMEEMYCYPKFREALEANEEHLVDEASEEHEDMKQLISELKTLSPEDSDFGERMDMLQEAVEHHVEEEEDTLLPLVQKELDKDTLEEMAVEMLSFKETRGMVVEE